MFGCAFSRRPPRSFWPPAIKLLLEQRAHDGDRLAQLLPGEFLAQATTTLRPAAPPFLTGTRSNTGQPASQPASRPADRPVERSAAVQRPPG